MKFHGKFLSLIFTLCVFSTPASPQGRAHTVLPGIDVLRERGFDILKGKHVGLVTNPSGVDVHLQSTVDILSAAPGVHLTALFGPEHGVRGDAAAGQEVASTTDPVTGVPVYSLYGKQHKPTAEMLKGVDVLVYDIQDIGVRSYTFISTLGQCMEAAAAKGIPFVVLDRPDPLGGIRIEGPTVSPGFTSFVSPYPIPYVYGLTPGELARMLNEEGMLAGGVRCSLLVVPMKGWKRSMVFSETHLQWVPTSPHIPFADGPEYYVATGIMGELGTLSEGVGYTLPFHLVGAPWINADRLASRLSAEKIPGVEFRPLTYQPFYGRDAQKELHGVQIYLVNPAVVDLIGLQFRVMEAIHAEAPDQNLFGSDKSRWGMFDRVIGNSKIREAFAKKYAFDDIRNLLNTDLREFKSKAARYFLYP
ncbi:MAG: DUF1343 domain-containing protein [Bacteroidota bacterium]